MIDWGEGDFFIDKNGEPSILTRRPTTKRWFRSLPVTELRSWMCNETPEVKSELRHTFYSGDGIQMYHLCVKYFHDLFLMDDVLELRKKEP